MKKYSLSELCAYLHPKHTRALQLIHEKIASDIYTLPGSISKHQAWKGGYLDHILEAMNIGLLLYNTLNSKRRLPFTLSEVLFCIYIHDLDKVLRHASKRKSSIHTSKEIARFIKDVGKYNLTQNEYNAVCYVHGEGKDYHPTNRVMLPLTTLVHCADVISARIWYSKGRNKVEW